MNGQKVDKYLTKNEGIGEIGYKESLGNFWT